MPADQHWVRVTKAFVMHEAQQIWAHLESFDDDFRSSSRFGAVDLRIGSETIRMRHVGTGNVVAELVVVLTLQDPRYRTVEELDHRMGERRDVYLARVSE